MTTSTLPQPSPRADTSKKIPLIALAGNPNTGKTTLFNALCGTRQNVGNYPGVTVEKKSGRLRLPGGPAELLDLPGLYSLTAVSPDEATAADVLMGRLSDDAVGTQRPDLVLCVLDATNLKRNLFLLSQLQEIGLPLIAVVTMVDLLPRVGATVDLAALEAELGVDVIGVEGRGARLRTDLERLQAAIQEKLSTRMDGLAPSADETGGVRPELPPDLQKLAETLQGGLAENGIAVSSFEARHLLLDREHVLFERIASQTVAQAALDEARTKVADLPVNPATLSIARYRRIDAVLAKVETRSKRPHTVSAKIDRVLTHRVFGLAAFAGIMFAVFQSIYSWAGPFMDWIDEGTGLLGETVGALLVGTPMLQSLVVDGIITGVGSVVIFLPQIIILFLFIAFLEDSGYLARAAFMMDRLLGWSGLNGRAFIPMLSSFACAVPGVMAARVMPDPRARLTTMLVAPLMSCSARLPVYLLLIGAFIEPAYGAGWAALTLFGMHALGLVVALPVAWILNRGFLKTRAIPFVLELPEYRWPAPRNVLFRAYEAGRKFLIRAGTVIFIASILVWALSYFPRPESVAQTIEAQYASAIAAAEAGSAESEPENPEGPFLDPELAELTQRMENEIAGAYLEQSYLGRFGHFIQPLFAPLGYDWKISVGILGAFPAREVIIATLGIIYSAGGDVDEESDTLRDRMAADTHGDGSLVYTPLVAFGLMVFFALCSQCMSTLATVWRELNDWRWAAFMFVYMTGLAYLFGMLIYQGGKALGFE